MATFNVVGTEGNDNWTIAQPGATVLLDGLGGTDTLYMGTEPRTSFEITLGADGAVHVDTISGASQPAFYTLRNIEIVVFDNRRDVVDLRTYFGDATPPVATFGTPTPGVANGNLVFTLAFDEAVTGLGVDDFTATAGSVLAWAGSQRFFSVVVAPPAGFEGSVSLTLKSGAVVDALGIANDVAVTSSPQPVDTRAPTVQALAPADGAAAVAPGSQLTIVFSEAVSRGSGSLTLASSTGAVLATVDLASSGLVTVSGSTLVVDLSATVAAGQSYRVQLPGGAVRDLAGNPLAAPSSWAFTTTAANLLSGTAADDLLVVGSGITSVDGGAGVDTAVFAGARASYSVAVSGSDAGVSAGGVSVALSQVERLRFADQSLAIDLGGAAGEVARTLGLVFGAAAVQVPAYVGLGLALLDGGIGYEGLMAAALQARLGSGYSSAQVVDLLYTSLAGVAPTAEQGAPFVALLDSGAIGAAALGVLAADTELNAAHIGLAGLAATGLAFS